MSILLPSLTRAREAGQRVDCFSNMRQLTLAWYFYAMDNHDNLCSPNTGWNDGSSGQNNNWVADGPDIPGNNIGNTEQAIAEGVLWNYTEETLGLYKCKSDHSSFLRSYSLCKSGNLNGIKKPSSKMIIIDASSSWRWLSGRYFPIEKQCSPPQWWPRSDPRQQLTIRHSGGCNTVFADFHCGWLKWQDPRTVQFVNQEMSAEEASDNNPDIERLLEMLK